jgi:hypothetical protein
MAARCPEATRRKPAADPTTGSDLDAYSLAEFCRRHSISVQLFYKFKDQMPDMFSVGTRVLVSKESAARWRAAREASTVIKRANGRPSVDPTDTEPTAHVEPTALTSAPTSRLALSIPEFCESFRIGEDFFYKLKRQGRAPRLMKVGARTLISLAAADEWRRDREAATAQG